MTTSDATRDFFERLGQRGREALFGTTTGTVAFELVDGKQTERWLVSVDRGALAVSHKRGKANCTVRASKDVFDGIVRGEANAMTALLRGLVTVEGDSKIVIRLLRLLPGPRAKR